MSLSRMVNAYTEQFKDIPAEQLNWLNDYVEKQHEEYKKSVDTGILNFGKYKGMQISKLSEDSKGREYLQWLLTQSSFVENPRNRHIIEAINQANIKKKTK